MQETMITLSFSPYEADLLNELLANEINTNSRITDDGRQAILGVIKHLNKQLSALPLTRAKFVIDAPDYIEGYHHEWERWNGWRCPAFELNSIISWLETNGQSHLYDPSTDTLVIRYPESDEEDYVVHGGDVLTTDGVKHLYGVGSGYWTWSVFGN